MPAGGALAFLAACGLVYLAAAVTTPSQDCVNSAIPDGFSLYPARFRVTPTQVTEAQDFSVTYYDTYKVLVNKRVNETYVLYQCGTIPPSASEIPPKSKLFSIPLASVSADDTSFLGFMKLLAVDNRVGFVTSYAVDPCMQALGAGGCKKLSKSIGSTSNATGVNQDGDVDAFITFGASTNPKSIAFSATADPGALNRAEWIKFVATLFNREAAANTIYAATKQTYNNIVKNVAAKSPKVAANRPLVAWVYYQPANPAWGEWGKANWRFYFSTYRMQMVQDAGGRPVNATDIMAKYGKYGSSAVQLVGTDVVIYNASVAATMMRDVLKSVSLVIDETAYPGVNARDTSLQNFMSAFGFSSQDIASYKFLGTGAVFRIDATVNANGDLDWFESAVALPQQVLQDLAVAITPSAVAGKPIPRFVRNLAKQQAVVMEAKQCHLQLTGCRLPVELICPNVYVACNGTLVYATNNKPCAPTCSSNKVASNKGN